MPAISIDTFFACALMVLIVLSAMATSSNLLYPYLDGTNNTNLSEKFGRIAEQILFSTGTPTNWGQISNLPETFGLAKNGSDQPYDLDIDKITKLNNGSAYGLNYEQIFTIMDVPDISFRLELRPLFEVNISLASEVSQTGTTTYQFEIATTEFGKAIPTILRYFVVANNYLDSNTTIINEKETYINVTLSNNIRGPVALAVLARASYDPYITSWCVYKFMNNSQQRETQSNCTRLSLLNQTLTVMLNNPTINLTGTYELSYNHNSSLKSLVSNSTCTRYNVPDILDLGAKIIIVTGWNGTSPFVEYVPYPELPVQLGATFDSTMSNVFSYSYLVLIDSGMFICTFWFGGPKT